MLLLTFIILFLYYIVCSKKGGLHLKLPRTITPSIQKKVIPATLEWQCCLSSFSSSFPFFFFVQELILLLLVDMHSQYFDYFTALHIYLNHAKKTPNPQKLSSPSTD